MSFFLTSPRYAISYACLSMIRVGPGPDSTSASQFNQSDHLDQHNPCQYIDPSLLSHPGRGLQYSTAWFPSPANNGNVNPLDDSCEFGDHSASSQLPPGAPVVDHSTEDNVLLAWQHDHNDGHRRSNPESVTSGAQQTDTSFVCDVCNKTYGRRSELNRHMKSHGNKNDWRFPCPAQGCNMRFYRQDKLVDHQQRVGH